MSEGARHRGGQYDERQRVDTRLNPDSIRTTAEASTMDSDLSVTAVRGTFWVYLSFLSGKGLTFLSTVILARFLTPEHFGLVAYSLLAVQYLDVLSSFGMGSAVIARREKLREAANAAFIMSLLVGSLLFLAAWFSAPYLATFFREPAVTDLFRALAIVLPLGSLGIVPSAMLEREMRFRTRLIPDITRNIIKGGLAVALAWQGFGAWSIIYGHIAGDVVAMILMIWLARWRPTMQHDRRVLREMAWYGWHSTLVGMVGAFRNQVDYILIGRLIGTQALGLYTLAYRIPDLLLRHINNSVGRVTLPILARTQNDESRLGMMYFAYLRYTALMIFPAGLGLAITAPILIRLFFTSEWEAAIPVMQWITIAVAVGSIGHAPGVLYKSISRPDILNKLAIVKAIFAVGVLWYSTRFGIVGVAIAQVPVFAFGILLDTVVIWRVLHFELREFFRALAPATFATTAMGGLLWIATTLFGFSGVPGLIALATLGVITYALALFLASRETFSEITGVARAMISRRSGRSAPSPEPPPA